MTLVDMVTRLRLKLNDRDTVVANRNFTDPELEDMITNAMEKFNTEYTLATVPESEEYLVLKLAQIDALYTLATWNAKEYRISVEGISIAKSERVTNYLKVAGQLEKEYQSIVSSPNFAGITVGNAKRYDCRSDELVGGDPVEEV